MTDVYGHLPLTESELKLVQSAVSNRRKYSFDRYLETTGKEKAFHSANVDRWDAITKKIDDIFISDTSQDPKEGE